MLGIDGKDDMCETAHSAVSQMLSDPILKGLPHSPFSHSLCRLQAQTILLRNCPPVKHVPLLVGCRQTPALVFKLNSPAQLLAHIAKNHDCHRYQEPVWGILI